MIRPDLFPVGEPGFVFDDTADQRANWRAYGLLALALLLVTLAVLGTLWWLDRVADPPVLRLTIHPRASWVPPLGPREKVLAILEQPTGERPR